MELVKYQKIWRISLSIAFGREFLQEMWMIFSFNYLTAVLSRFANLFPSIQTFLGLYSCVCILLFDGRIPFRKWPIRKTKYLITMVLQRKVVILIILSAFLQTVCCYPKLKNIYIKKNEDLKVTTCKSECFTFRFAL